MFYTPHERNHGLPHDPFQALVVPRPVGWISTCSLAGAVNLAPFSYFNALSSNPWLVAYSASSEKDSVAFALETGEFVANFASGDLLGPMVQSSVDAPRGVSEFEFAGLTRLASVLVRPPRVGEACAALECRVTDIYRPPSALNPGGAPFVVVGEVIGVFIRDDVLTDGLVDIAKTRPVGRLGYLDYAIVDHSFQMKRPGWKAEPDR